MSPMIEKMEGEPINLPDNITLKDLNTLRDDSNHRFQYQVVHSNTVRCWWQDYVLDDKGNKIIDENGAAQVKRHYREVMLIV